MRSRTRAVTLTGVLAASLLLTGCEPEGSPPDTRGDEVTATPTPPLVVPEDVAVSTGDAAASTEDAAVATDDAALSTDDAAESAADDAAATSAPAREEVDLGALINDQELLDQTRWILDHLQPGASGPDVVAISQRFDQPFLDQVPALQLGLIIAQLRADGPYTVTEASQVDGLGRSASLRLHSPDQPLVMTISLDPEGLIAGLLFIPDTSGEPPQIETWADLDEALTELGGEAQVVVGEARDGACTPVHTTPGVDPADPADPGGEPFPSGSVAKLIVLAGLVEAVEAGDLAWDEEMTITDEVKSLPSGVLQERESGSTVTVQEAAELMIAISDNTATDLLIGAVGQAQLRRSMEAAGVDPLRVAPLTTTKELFILGWGVDQEVRDRWARASVPEVREAQLADLPTDLSTVDVSAVTTPVWQDGVDWILTGGEICSLHARLQQLAATEAGEPVRAILSANPGGPVPEGASYVAFKGGSVPGVLALSYYVETGDPASDPGEGTGTVLTVQIRSEDPVDQLRAVTIVEAGLQHLVASDD